MERRPAAVTRLRAAADAGKSRITGAARRDRAHAVGRAGLNGACAPAWFAGAITRRAAKEVKT